MFVPVCVTLILLLLSNVGVDARRQRTDSCPPDSTLQYISPQTGVYNCRCNTPGYIMNTERTRCVVPKQHGESCQNPDDVCNPDIQFMSCYDGTCQCQDQGHWDAKKSICYNQKFCHRISSGFLFYSSELKSCVARVGMPLSLDDFSIEFACPANSSMVETEERQTYGRSQKIVSCQCDTNFTVYWDWESCVPTRYKDESCHFRTNRCNPASRLTCVKTTTGSGEHCQCPESDVWDAVKNKCLIQAGQNCSTDFSSYRGAVDECAPGASCPKSFGNGSSTCTCGSSYATVNGICLKKNGISCKGIGECVPPNICADGVCSCPHPLYQRYDPETEVCRTKARLPCEMPNTEHCTANAECVDGDCICKLGFRDDLNGNCIPSKEYGENCTASECDANQGLSCSEGVCRCVDPFLDFQQGTGCLGSVSNECGVLTTLGQFEDPAKKYEYIVKCKEGLYCKPSCSDNNCLARDKKAPGRCMAI